MARHLTFREFARLKARQMIIQAQDLLAATIAEQGYTNSDRDGFGFRVHRGRRPTLEMVGFDFEYYRHDPVVAQEHKGTRGAYIAGGQRAEALARHGGTRRIAAAATLIMMSENGEYMPSEPLVF